MTTFATMLSLQDSEKTKRKLLFVVWLGLVLFVSVHHEIWRDEMRAMSIAREIDSIPSLQRLLLNEGLPVLWYVLLASMHALYPSVHVLHILAFLIGAVSVWLLLFHSRLPVLVAGLSAFSVVFFYENTIMCRNYGIACMFILLIELARRHQRYFTGIVLIALLMQTNAPGFLVGLVLCLQFAMEWRPRWFHDVRPWLAFVLVCSSALLFFLITTPDHHSNLAGFRDKPPLQLLTSVCVSLVYPNHFLTREIPLLGFGIFLLLSAFFYSRPRLLLYFWLVAAGLNFFSLEVNVLSVRHLGVFFTFFLMLIAQLDFTTALPVWLRTGVLPLGLWVLVGANFYYAGLDVMKPLSNSKLVAEFVNQPAYKNAILIAEPDYCLDALPYYTDHEMYVAREHRDAEYVCFTKQNKNILHLQELVNLDTCFTRPILLLSGTRLEHCQPNDTLCHKSIVEKRLITDAASTKRFQFIKEFGGAITDENYLLYELKPAQ